MCRHQYTTPVYGGSSHCVLAKYYAESEGKSHEDQLPVDDAGYCLFHSSDLNWKAEFDFPAMLLQLLQLLEAGDDNYYDLRGLISVTAPEKELVLSDMILRKSLNLSGAVFHQPLKIINCHFKQSLFLDEIVCHEAFVLEHCQVDESFTAIGASIFHQNFYCIDVRFGQLFDLKEAIFKGQISCSDVSFNGYTVWDNAQYLPQHYAVAYFRASFSGYTTFNDTVWAGPVHFDEIAFNGDTNFIGADFRKEFYLVSPRINANVRFSGYSETARIFDHEVNMTLTESSFIDAGQLLFEHANLLSLNREAKHQLPQLKANRQIVLGEGCIVYQVAFRRSYPFAALNAVFLEDLTQTIRQYFIRKIGRHYEVVFAEQDDQLVVTFYTDDYVSEADFRKEEVAVIRNLRARSGRDTTPLENVLQEKFAWQLRQAIDNTVKGYLQPEVLQDIFSKTEISLLLSGSSIERITANNLVIQEVRESTIYVDRLQQLPNDPIFSLNEPQFNHLKAELLKLQAGQWEDLENLLSDIKNEVVSKDRLAPFLAETGIGIANNLSAGVLFLVLERLLLG